MIRLLFVALIAACSDLAAQPILKETPRTNYIREFNYFWDLKSKRQMAHFDAPFFGNFRPEQLFNHYNGCAEFPNDYQCIRSGDQRKIEEIFSADSQDYSLGSIFMGPYTLEEVGQQPYHWAYVPSCNGSFVTLADGGVFADNQNTDYRVRNAELQLSETTFTKRFLDFINADEALEKQVEKSGLGKVRTNKLLRQAWLEGRLKKPAMVVSYGECGDGGNVVRISFKEPTKRFQIIPDFDYLLCKSDGLNPWNVDQCPHVRDRLVNLQVLSGRYRVRITRSDGEILFREIDISHLSDDELLM